MKNTYQKFCMIMAMSTLTKKEIQEIYDIVSLKTKTELLDDVAFFKHVITNINERGDFDYSLSKQASSHNKMMNKVYNLLIKQANLSEHEAIYKITEYIYKKNSISNFCLNDAEKLSDIIEKLLNILSQREILSAATQVRNDVVKNTDMTWHLKEK